MDVITSHTNADFDALASMVAAAKLYPGAKLVFPGSQEKSMRDFFLESAFYALEAERLRTIDVSQVDRLIIVDNRNPARLGKLADALARPGLTVHIYDHHPPSEGDLKGSIEIVEQVGATTTLMVELLRRRDIDISAIEATVFALGIYEETGSLTYVSTTERDAQAAAYLIGKGAQLTIVSDFISRELSHEQQEVLKGLREAATSYDINGVPVVISALATTSYIPDLANLAHKMRDDASLDVLFLVVQMSDKTQIVGRSRVPAVHVGAVMQQLGGGGHASAGSAATRDITYLQARERLIDLLKRQIRPGLSVRDIMTAPVKSVPAGSTLQQSNEAMTRFSVNVLPVLKDEVYQGIITREAVQKALFHGLGRQKVEEFMITGGPVASPDWLMDQVERTMLEEHQRFIPVLDHRGSLVGAVTRTDLLRSLHEERLTEVQGREQTARPIRNVHHLMEERFPDEIGRLLAAIGEVADEAGFPVYLVGGIVRDLFLHVRNLDVDIVVEGDGITFAGLLMRRTGGRMKTHVKFGTAVVVLPQGVKIDIATARLEYYDSPAALPTIELSSIKKDLYRRDFTVNTLAVRLNRKRFGELLDFFGGLRDIKERTLRVLHSLSFVEDPTRVLRAIRFEQRFDFRMSKHTLHLIRGAVVMKVFNRLSGERIYNELVLLFSEVDPAKVLRRMRELDVLKFLHPALKGSSETERLFDAIGDTLTWFRLLYLEGVTVETWFVYFLGLLDRLKKSTPDEVLERLAVPGRVRERIRRVREGAGEALYILYREPELKPSGIHKVLSPLDTEALLVMMAKAKQEKVRKAVSLYFTHLREVRISVTGDDLRRLGIPPGPRYRKLLAQLLDAKLDGLVPTHDDEIAFIREKAG